MRSEHSASMPAEYRLQGLIPPLVTPLFEDESLDLESLRRQAAWVVANGASGLWVNGTSGEFHALSRGERGAVVAAVREAMPSRDGVLVAQVGAASTRDAIGLAADAVAAGADVISAVTPYYLSFNDQELMDYYRAIRATVTVPLMIYQVPMMAKAMLRVDTVLALAREGTIVGIKDSSGDISWLNSLVSRAASEEVELRAFVGGGSMVHTSLLAGAAGAMCAVANIVPAHCSRLVAAGLAGDWPLAAALQGELMQVIRAMELPSRTTWTSTLSVLKFVLAERGVIATATCARPVRPLEPAEQDRLRTLALPVIERLGSETPDAQRQRGSGRVHANP
jgi:4-hydroxy-tetrahydrodipicolinate synthase